MGLDALMDLFVGSCQPLSLRCWELIWSSTTKSSAFSSLQLLKAPICLAKPKPSQKSLQPLCPWQLETKMVNKNPELLPKVEHPELLPKVEPTLAKDANKKKRKKKNPQKPILIHVDADGNPIIDGQKAIVIKQALPKSEIKANPEPVPILTAVQSKKRKRKKSKTTVPVDAAKKVKVDAEPEPILTAVKSKKRKRKKSRTTVPVDAEPEPILTAVKSKKSKTTVPVDAANQVDVAAQVGVAGQEDVAKKVKMDAEPEPILTAVKSEKRKKKKSKTRVPVDAPAPVKSKKSKTKAVAVKGKNSNTKAVKSKKSKTKAVNSKKSKTKAVNSKKSKTTEAEKIGVFFWSEKKIDIDVEVEGPKYVEICVICRKKGHLIPTCPELNEEIVPNLNHNTEQKKESRKKGSARPQPPQDVKMRKGQDDRLLVTGCALQVDPMADETYGGKEDESTVKLKEGQEDRLLVTGCALQVDPMVDETYDGKEDESTVKLKEGQEDRLLVTGCTLQVDSMADGTYGGKEDESTVKVSQESHVKSDKKQDPEVVNSGA